MGALATLLRPYITRPTPAIPAPIIQIHAPDTQINTTQAAYTDEEAQPRDPLTAATILQRAYDAKYSDTDNTAAPTYADKLLATQSEMYRDARRSSCINVEEGWTEVTGKKAISKKKPTYKELFDTSSEDEPNAKLPAAQNHSLYRKEEVPDATKHSLYRKEEESPALLQKQEEEDLAYAQALQNFKKLMELVRPAKYNKHSRAGGDGIGTPGTDPDHDVRRPFSSADITKYRKKLIKARDKKGIHMHL
ncbi:hypothetical protein B484DRAFT_389632 [Ochromonadaceae sp. CCMP2298]|nr:hypothetical protein B484DRAFT_389632 [Ochromonadaceae sp. CCMP2298]